MPIVYIDILFAVNWFVDFLLLSATARVFRLTPKQFRLVLGGLVGGMLSCALFLVTLPTWSVMVLHIIIAGAMITVSFCPVGITPLVSRVIVLYCLSGLFSGSVTALSAFTKSDLLFGRNGVVYMDISPLALALFACISYGVLCIYEHITRNRVPKNQEFVLEIEEENGCCLCRALYDTGLCVTEPFSGRPVVIVESTTIERCIPPELYRVLVMRVLPEDGALRRVRMIPYHAVGKEGVLPAFVPRKLRLRSQNGDIKDISGTYLAVTDRIGCDGYEALIGTDSVRKEGVICGG